MRKTTAAVLFGLFVPFFTSGAHAKDMSGVVDLTGKVVIPIQYKSVFPVNNWLFICEGFNTPPGAVLPKPAIEPLSAVKKKVFTATTGRNLLPHARGATTLLDNNGKPVAFKIPPNLVIYDVFIPSKYQPIEPFSKLPPDVLITVAGKDGYGIADGNGTIIIEPKFRSFDALGSIPIRMKSFTTPDSKLNGDKFDLDLEFQRSLQKDTPQGKAAFAAHEGMIRFSKNGLFGFKDTTGKVKIPAKYYAAREFACGFAPVRLNPFTEDGRYVYIDHNGKTASKEYFRAEPFVGKTAIIAMYSMRSLTYGLIDKKFEYIQQPYCHGLTRMKDGMVVPKAGMISKVFDKDGKPVFDIPFNRTLVNDGVDGLVFRSREKQKETTEVYDTSGKIIKTSSRDIPKTVFPEFLRTNVSKGSNGELLSTIETMNGKVIIGPTDDILFEVGDKLVIRTVHSKSFSKDDWSGPDRNPEGAFEAFIKHSKPVGMSKPEVEKLLGKGKDEGDNVVSYNLSVDGLGTPLGVIRYKDGKVEAIDTRYATVVGGKPGIMMPNPHSRIVPARIESSSGFNYNATMEVVPVRGKSGEKKTLHIKF